MAVREWGTVKFRCESASSPDSYNRPARSFPAICCKPGHSAILPITSLKGQGSRPKGPALPPYCLCLRRASLAKATEVTRAVAAAGLPYAVQSGDRSFICFSFLFQQHRPHPTVSASPPSAPVACESRGDGRCIEPCTLLRGRYGEPDSARTPDAWRRSGAMACER